jgi:hypothetical protein
MDFVFLPSGHLKGGRFNHKNTQHTIRFRNMAIFLCLVLVIFFSCGRVFRSEIALILANCLVSLISTRVGSRLQAGRQDFRLEI